MEELEKDFAEIASLFGDKSRAIMLWNLLDGRAYTVTELANCSGISMQSASNHLSKLLSKEVLIVVKQGRHRYYKFRNPKVAQVVESIASLMSIQKEYKKIQKPTISNFTYARTCYKHLAGQVSVDITKGLISQNYIIEVGENFEVTYQGYLWFLKFGIDTEKLKRLKRSFAHQCLDWSERKYHLAGALGDAFLERMLEKDWFTKRKDTRALILTTKGRFEIQQQLNINL